MELTGRRYDTGEPIRLEVAGDRVHAVTPIAVDSETPQRTALDRAGAVRLAGQRIWRPGIQLADADARGRRADCASNGRLWRRPILPHRDHE